MIKPPEEGEIWEWRAFGRVSDSLAERVRAYPIRFGLSDLRGEDIYLVAPHSNQNVKLRRYANGWLLKLKLLIGTQPGSFERYKESAEFTNRFPVSRKALEDAARLLEVEAPNAVASAATFSEEAFVRAFAESSPPAIQIRVSKRRSQYQFQNGWLELADVTFSKQQVQSISIHSPNIDVVREMTNRLQTGDELTPMNYIEACRRWG